MDNLYIRKLERADAERVVDIYDTITQAPVAEGFQQIIEEHADRDSGACFVAVLDNQVVGFMVSYVLTGGFGIAKSAWIANLGVDPKYMGQGIGGKMADEVFKFYRALGIKDLYTSVRWDSGDMLSFFKNLGFDRSNFINLRKIIE